MENVAAGVLGLEIWRLFHHPFWLHFYLCLVPVFVCTNIFHWNLLFVPSRFGISEYPTLPTKRRGSSTNPGKKLFHVPMSSLVTAKQHISSHSASENWKWPPKNFKESQLTCRCSIDSWWELLHRFFQVINDRVRRNSLSLHQGSYNGVGYWEEIFTNWAVKHWNRLPTSVVEPPSLEVFRKREEVALRDMG